jgi:hypothetical protein
MWHTEAMTKQPPGPTPVRNLRVSDEIWETALQNATNEGRTLTEVITSYLKRYNAAATGKRPPGPVAAPATVPPAPRQTVPLPTSELPDHAERVALQERLTIEELRDFARDTREAHNATQPKHTGQPITDEALSLGIYFRACKAGCYNR